MSKASAFCSAENPNWRSGGLARDSRFLVSEPVRNTCTDILPELHLVLRALIYAPLFAIRSQFAAT